MVKRITPLLELHQQSKAHFVDFHGWQMPLHYGSQLNEHHAVRQSVGMFDASHMVILDILGAGARQVLRHILANDVDCLSHIGCAMYTCMLNHGAGIVDDLIVYSRAPDNYRLVLNSVTRNTDLAWIQRYSSGISVGIQERDELSMIAIQGPETIEQLSSVINPAQQDALSTLDRFQSVDVEEWFIARTGYTGEDGVEIILPMDDALQLWQALLDAGVQPCGLGARDTLRLEAGMLLYGHEMDETTSPYESALEWTVALEPHDRDFIGRAALELQKEQGIKNKLVGLMSHEKTVMHPGSDVIVEGIGEGTITSGSFSPTLDCSIALARVPIDTKDRCIVETRDKRIEARVGKPRFIKNGESLWEK